jgi:ABC-type nitrate/sulfonate/bicarbonate transport system substrate-binding protein
MEELTRREFLKVAGAGIAGAALLGAAGCGQDTGGGGQGSGGGGQGTSTLRVGVLPFLDYTGWVAMKQLGIDKEQGLDIGIQSFPLEPNEVQAFARGALDVASGAIGSLIPLVPQAKDMRLVGNLNQFRGFAFIVRRNSGFTPYQDLVKKLSPAEARRKSIAQMKGKTIVTIPSSFEATIVATLQEAGLSKEDVKIQSFADSAGASIAFIRGEGDVFVGGLPETVKLLTGEYAKDYTALVRNEQMGPAGLWFSNFAVSKDFLENRRGELMKLLAAWYRTVRYIRERPDQALQPMVDYLAKSTGGGIDLEQAKKQVPDFVSFQTIEESQETVFNSKSDAYWRVAARYMVEQNQKLGKIPKDYNLDWVVQEELFNELLDNRKLLDFVNRPL